MQDDNIVWREDNPDDEIVFGVLFDFFNELNHPHKVTVTTGDDEYTVTEIRNDEPSQPLELTDPEDGDLLYDVLDEFFERVGNPKNIEIEDDFVLYSLTRHTDD